MLRYIRPALNRPKARRANGIGTLEVRSGRSGPGFRSCPAGPHASPHPAPPGNPYPADRALGTSSRCPRFAEGGTEHIVFRGFILRVALDFGRALTSTARLTAVTASYKLDLTPRQVYYKGTNASDIIGRLVAPPLTLRNDLKLDKVWRYGQYGETDFQFVRGIADGLEGWVRPIVSGENEGLLLADAFQEARGKPLVWGDADGLLTFGSQAALAPTAFGGGHYDDRTGQRAAYRNVTDSASFSDALQPLVDSAKSQSANLPPGYQYRRGRLQTLDDYHGQLKKESRRTQHTDHANITPQACYAGGDPTQLTPPAVGSLRHLGVRPVCQHGRVEGDGMRLSPDDKILTDL